MQQLCDLAAVRHRDLGGVGGRGRPPVRDIVGDRDVRLVSDRRDDGDAGGVDRTGDALVVESPEVFDGAAAASGDDEVRHIEFVGVADRARDLRRRFRPLHAHRHDKQLRHGPASAEDADHIVHRRPGRGGDDRNASRDLRQRLLVGVIKQALFLQPCLELLKGDLQIAGPLGHQLGAVELIRPVAHEHGDAPPRRHPHAALRTEAEPGGAAFEHHAAQAALTVLERKIVVPGGVDLVVGELAPDADVGEHGFALQQIADDAVELCYGKRLVHRLLPPFARSSRRA